MGERDKTVGQTGTSVALLRRFRAKIAHVVASLFSIYLRRRTGGPQGY